MLVVVVPARGNSKGIPGKNLKKVGGRTLVARAVTAGATFLQRAGTSLANAVLVVDTDDPQIAEEGARHGALVPFLREPHFAEDATSSFASCQRLLERLGERGIAPTDLMLLQPTSPLRTADDIAACWSAYAERGHSAVTICSTGRAAAQFLNVGTDGRLSWASGAAPASSRRQDAAMAWYANGAVYCIATDVLLSQRTFIVGDCTIGVPMPRWRSVDIDEPADLAMADLLAGLPDDETEKLP